MDSRELVFLFIAEGCRARSFRIASASAPELGPTARVPRAAASSVFASTAHPDLVHAMTLGVASLLSSSWRTWQRLGQVTGLEVKPWVDATGGGLVVGSHF